ncbi:hypothetical protein [Rhodococcus qingshengii]|uniref:hypothetical protein n=1 Tax=Rhodococcus qingshengii TaxID=334542 RepID=UPI0035DEA9ED
MNSGPQEHDKNITLEEIIMDMPNKRIPVPCPEEDPAHQTEVRTKTEWLVVSRQPDGDWLPSSSSQATREEGRERAASLNRRFPDMTNQLIRRVTVVMEIPEDTKTALPCYDCGIESAQLFEGQCSPCRSGVKIDKGTEIVSVSIFDVESIDISAGMMEINLTPDQYKELTRAIIENMKNKSF